MKHAFNVGDSVRVVGQYSGLQKGPFKVLAVSPKGAVITIERPDFATGQERFSFSPSTGRYFTSYSGYIYAG